MITPGVCTTCQGFSQDLAGLAICRALMGVFESGFVPGTGVDRSGLGE